MPDTSKPITQEGGQPLPLGATKRPDGWNFAVYSQSPVETLLLATMSHPAEIHTFKLDPNANRTGSIWHIFIKTDEKALYYGFSVASPTTNLLLVDPYARVWDGGSRFGDNAYSTKRYLTHPIALVVDNIPFDWGGDESERLARQDLIIYEMHLRGFTKDPSSRTAHPGSYSGVIEKIPYLKQLGVNAVEFLPLTEFDETENHNINPKTKKPLCNFWGYSPLSFFAPMQRYASSDDPLANIKECKEMVQALHKAGIEVIIDVVFNHTGEGNEHGPSISWKGFAESDYYLKDSQGHFLNYSGCGNTLNCNHPIVSDMIIEALRYWVIDFHIDGFRFDLASILSRGQDGMILDSAPLIERITQDPILSHCKLIAEPWDAAGHHQVGSFYQTPWQGPEQWMEWNDDFRTVVRRFLKGTQGYAGRFATKLCGSEDLYGKDGTPLNSINYITCHDGYTLRDLVSYQQKHNLENGENNRDGMDNNDSWNCGAEGSTTDSQIEFLRQRQMKNFWLALFVSAGVPMIMMGDEYGHTKLGNNNTWCHDDEKNWFLWNEVENESAHVRFCKALIAFRKNCPLLKRSKFYKKEEIDWHGVEPRLPDWAPRSQFVAFSIKDRENRNDLYIAFNANPFPCQVHLPKPPQARRWMLIVNTALPSPKDYIEEKERRESAAQIQMAPYSAIMLQAQI